MTMQALGYAGILFDCPGRILNVRTPNLDCSMFPDGLCEALMPDPSLLVAPEKLTVRFPLEGGTVRLPQVLTLSQGHADGDATITLTPIEPS